MVSLAFSVSALLKPSCEGRQGLAIAASDYDFATYPVLKFQLTKEGYNLRFKWLNCTNKLGKKWWC